MSRGTLKLDRLELSGLRSIGWSDTEGRPQLALQEIPDVAIIAGPNGLGKSTIIAGLRIALTGNIPGRDGSLLPYAALRSSEGKGHTSPSRVVVAFDGDQPLTLEWQAQDQVAFEAAADSVLDKVSDLSAHPGLSGRSVAARLRVTHLLSQGWGSRFTDDLDGKPNRALLTEALGDSLLTDRIGMLLNQGPVIKVLRDRAKRAGEQLDAAQKALDEWGEGISRWQSMRVSHQDLLQPAVDHARTTLQQHIEVLGQSLEVDGSLKRAITQVEAAVRSAKQGLAQARERLQRLRDSSDQAEALIIDLADAEATVAEAKEASESSNEQLRAAQHHLLALELARLSAEEGSLRREVVRLAGEIANSEEALRTWRLREQHADATRLHEEATLLSKERDALQIAECLETVAAAKSALAELEEGERQFHQRRSALLNDRSELHQAVARLREHVAASAPIAGDSVRCPACWSPFNEATVLLEAMQGRLEMLEDDSLTLFDQEARRLEKELEGARREAANAQEDLEARRAAARDIEARLNTAIQEAEALGEKVIDELTDAHLRLGDEEASVFDLLSRALEGRLEPAQGRSGLEERLEVAREALQQARERLDVLPAEVASRRAALPIEHEVPAVVPADEQIDAARKHLRELVEVDNSRSLSLQQAQGRRKRVEPRTQGGSTADEAGLISIGVGGIGNRRGLVYTSAWRDGGQTHSAGCPD